jgi:hypothetical protein
MVLLWHFESGFQSQSVANKTYWLSCAALAVPLLQQQTGMAACQAGKRCQQAAE